MIRILSYPGFDIDQFIAFNPHLVVTRYADRHSDVTRKRGRVPGFKKCTRCGFEAVLNNKSARVIGWRIVRGVHTCPRCMGVQ